MYERLKEIYTEFELKFGIQKVDLIINNHKDNLPIYEIAKKGIKL